jgi:hypothetical protein
MEGDVLVNLMDSLRSIERKLREIEVADVENFEWVHQETKSLAECQDALKRLKKSPKVGDSVPQMTARKKILDRLSDLKDIRVNIRVRPSAGCDHERNVTTPYKPHVATPKCKHSSAQAVGRKNDASAKQINELLAEASKVFANERLRGIRASRTVDSDANDASVEWSPLTGDDAVIQSISTAWKEFSRALASVDATQKAANESISLGKEFFNIDAKAMLSHREASVLLAEHTKVMVKAIGRATALCAFQEAQAKAVAVVMHESMQETAHRLQARLRVVRTRLKAGRYVLAAKQLYARLTRVQGSLVQFPRAKQEFLSAKRIKQNKEVDLEEHNDDK